MIAQCSTCGKTFEISHTGIQVCPHCKTKVYIEGMTPSGPPPGKQDSSDLTGGRPLSGTGSGTTIMFSHREEDDSELKEQPPKSAPGYTPPKYPPSGEAFGSSSYGEQPYPPPDEISGMAASSQGASESETPSTGSSEPKDSDPLASPPGYTPPKYPPSGEAFGSSSFGEQPYPPPDEISGMAASPQGAFPPGTPPPGSPPPGSPPPSDPHQAGCPFERRSELGFFSAFFMTVKEALFDPARLFGSMNITDVKGAFLFGWICITVSSVFSVFWNLISSFFTSSDMGFDELPLPPEYLEILEAFASDPGPLFYVAMMFFSPVLSALYLLIYIGLVHLGAMIFGAAGRGWNASLHAVCYGSAPWLIAVVPFCGGIIGGIWTIILYIYGLYILQKTSVQRASFAVLIWFLLFCFCCCLVFPFMTGFMMSMGQGMMQP